MMGVGRALALAIAALLVGAARAEAAELAVTRQLLRNGMTVLVREDPSATVVALSLQVRAGSAFEPDTAAGITNFLQHAMLRGTTHRSARQIAEAAEELGGTIDASGDVETAEVRAAALARNWEPLLALLAEVALEPTLPPAEIARERALIIARIRTRDDSPYQHAFDALLATLYVDHPYARQALGRPETLAGITRDALAARYAAIYRPERMVLAVSGGAPASRVVVVASRLFARLTRGNGAAPALPTVVLGRGERRVVEAPASQAQIFVGFTAPPLDDPAYAASRVLAAVLGGGMSGRLFGELRERRGLAYGVGAIGTYRTGPAFLIAYLGTAPPNADVALEALLAEITRLRDGPVSEAEVERAKAYVLGTLAMDRRTNRRWAWYLAFFETIGAGWQFPDRYARAVGAVTPSDVAAAAKRILNRPTVVVLRPPAEGAPPAEPKRPGQP